MTRLLLLAFFGAAVRAQAGEAPILEIPVGSLGVATVVGVKGEQTRLRLVFAAGVVENPNGGQIPSGETTFTKGPVTIKGELVLFDRSGVVHRFTAKPFTMRFWCENDGGYQVRPELELSVTLPRALVPQPALQNLAGFIVVAPKGKPPSLPALTRPAGAPKLALVGDLDGDGRPEAGLETAPDPANNCDGKPRNNLTIELVMATGAESLRCCGP